MVKEVMKDNDSNFTDEDVTDFEVLQLLNDLHDKCAEYNSSISIYKIFDLYSELKKEFIFTLGQRWYADFAVEFKEKCLKEDI